MSLTVYGVAQSRAARTLWMANELGVDYENDPGYADGGPSESLLAVNPMGQMPVIDDDGFVLAESMAINLYLAKKHGKLAPASLQDEAQTLRWSFWVTTAVEQNLLDALMKGQGLMGNEKDEAAAAECIAALARPFRVLDEALDGRDYLLGDEFTVADLNVASVFTWAKPAGIDFSDHPNIAAWLARCLSREAAKKVG